jgi:hypothetical protein
VERVSNFLEEQEIRRLHDERRKGAGDRIPDDAQTSED